MSKHEIDKHTGVETTGHEWDGIKELNNPAPRWWLWLFYITVIWSIGYWVVYPAWPTLSGDGSRGGTMGSAEWTQYRQLEQDQQEILARQQSFSQAFEKKSLEQIMQDPKLYAFAKAGGKSAFKDNCATCHGTGGAGALGYPNLNDDDWIWGGSLDEIYATIAYGVRSDHEDTHISTMPAFGDMLSDEELNSLTDYVLALSTNMIHPHAAEGLYQDNCASCHGVDGRGMKEFGAPNLADQLWFRVAPTKQSVKAQLKKPSHGMMPAWQGRLSEDTIRQLTIYVHSLGGGE